jgi:two-component system NtrC family sensor kinase
VFSLDDFSEDGAKMDFMVLRDEYRVSLSDAKKATVERMESESKLRSLIDTMSEGVVLIDTDGQLKDANRAAEDILGISKDEITGRSFVAPEWHILTPDGGPMPFEDMPGPMAMRTLKPVRDVEMLVVQPSGSIRRINCSASPVFNQSSALDGVVGTFVDITVSRNIENVLARNEATMRAILENAPFGVMLIDREYRIISMVNPYAARLIGLRPDEIEGRVCHQFICTAELGKCPLADLGQTVDNSERVLLSADGRRIPILKTVVPVKLQDQSFLLDCFVDITDRKALEVQLNQAQKLESVGRLAAGIAHEINTPSQYVGDNAHFLKDAFAQLVGILSNYTALKVAVKEGGDINGIMEEIERAESEADLKFLLEDIPKAVSQSIEGIEHVSNIVRAMKEFAHPGQEQMSHADINRALQTTVTVSCNEWKYAAEIQTDFDPVLPEVPCYPGEINQVFLNLIVNASHAVADARKERGDGLGKIVLRTKRNGPFVEIRIEDNGTGIPEGIRDKVMEPFFTTKEVGKGTGQGLAIARSCVVDKHKGMLTFETEEGKGTTFIISLPINRPEGRASGGL